MNCRSPEGCVIKQHARPRSSASLVLGYVPPATAPLTVPSREHSTAAQGLPASSSAHAAAAALPPEGRAHRPGGAHPGDEPIAQHRTPPRRSHPGDEPTRPAQDPTREEPVWEMSPPGG
ncbi:hypothetical protein P7K49_021163 [Saguinus oedipus]|uniref:Uncharacterized protein n=1 Tax=Saguinus oedipus TaxID=9490 RepID=A0ABQ9URV9_SAGOE|nr:hypothetical protein P7K49_021163 [Saguinus oedipus]